MKLNCKEGDLAVIVSSASIENVGIVVRVVKQHVPPTPYGESYEAYGDRFENTYTGHLWEIESQGRPIKSFGTDKRLMVRMYADYALKPLRDTDGEDEMLRIAGKPRELEKMK